MTIKPSFDRVLVRRIESEQKTSGGIIIPDTAKEKPAEGLRGEDGKFLPVIFKKGQRILFTKWSGTEVKHQGEELVIMKESDILAVVE